MSKYGSNSVAGSRRNSVAGTRRNSVAGSVEQLMELQLGRNVEPQTRSQPVSASRMPTWAAAKYGEAPTPSGKPYISPTGQNKLPAGYSAHKPPTASSMSWMGFVPSFVLFYRAPLHSLVSRSWILLCTSNEPRLCHLRATRLVRHTRVRVVCC